LKAKSGVIFFLLLSLTYFKAFAQIDKTTRFINPTGSYVLDSKTTTKDGEIYGPFGEIDIKLLDSSRIAISFFVCKGAPNYNMGTFIDTLIYRNNVALRTTPEDDTTCRIKFTFTRKVIIAEQTQANLNFGCGFGHAVFADGSYKKISGKIPIIAGIEEKYSETNGILRKN
jgi:hypothetical protein